MGRLLRRLATPLLLLSPLTLLTAACVPSSACEGGEPELVVVSRLSSATIEGGVSVGFDLDGRVSDATDAEACGVADFVHPDGTPGIDNSMGTLFDALAAVGGAAVEDLVAEAIATGELLLLFELTGVDDPLDDSCVQLRVLRGSGSPGTGADGRILSGQTFELRDDVQPILVEGQSLEGGRLLAEGFEMDVPVVIFETPLEFTLQGSVLEMDIDTDGQVRGVLAGGISSDDLRSTGESIDEGVAAAVEAAVEHNADLAISPTGFCQAVSTVLEFEAVPAFLFAD